MGSLCVHFPIIYPWCAFQHHQEFNVFLKNSVKSGENCVNSCICFVHYQVPIWTYGMYKIHFALPTKAEVSGCSNQCECDLVRQVSGDCHQCACLSIGSMWEKRLPIDAGLQYSADTWVHCWCALCNLFSLRSYFFIFYYIFINLK